MATQPRDDSPRPGTSRPHEDDAAASGRTARRRHGDGGRLEGVVERGECVGTIIAPVGALAAIVGTIIAIVGAVAEIGDSIADIADTFAQGDATPRALAATLAVSGVTPIARGDPLDDRSATLTQAGGIDERPADALADGSATLRQRGAMEAEPTGSLTSTGDSRRDRGGRDAEGVAISNEIGDTHARSCEDDERPSDRRSGRDDTMGTIATSQTTTTAEIIRAALGELLYGQKEVAQLLGISVRTVQRHPRLWGFGGPDDIAKLVRALWPRNAALARQLAEHVHLDVVAMGLAPKPPPPPPAALVAPPAPPKPPEARPEHAAAVLCAAADAMNVAPREVKQLVTAIFKAVAAMDVDHRGLAKLLAQGEAMATPAQAKG